MPEMRRFYAISLLLLYLFTNTELHQFMRLPVLLAHYHEHVQTDSSITLAGFLVLHYVDDHAGSSKHAKHHDLPFKSHACTATPVFAVLPVTPLPSVAANYSVMQFKMPEALALPSSSILFSIWQPPRA